MSEWYDNQKKQVVTFRSCCKNDMKKLIYVVHSLAEEAKRIAKLEAIADKLKRGENVQNRQLQTWLKRRSSTHR